MVIFPISIFSQIRSEGGVIKYHFFPKFKIVHIILGGGGSRKLWTFSTICEIFFWIAPLSGGRSYIFDNERRFKGILGSENVINQLLSEVFQ